MDTKEMNHGSELRPVRRCARYSSDPRPSSCRSARCRSTLRWPSTRASRRSSFRAGCRHGGPRAPPTSGWLTLTEVVAHAKRVARSVDIPVYCDADTGFGAPINVQRTVQEFIDAGVAGIHIEDQREPKKSGGTTGIELVSDAEAIGRLNAAVDARDRLDADFVIVARTDGYGAAGGGVDEAIRRAQLYRAETGVDAIFYEGFHTWEQAELALKETPGPNYVMGAQPHRPAAARRADRDGPVDRGGAVRAARRP